MEEVALAPDEVTFVGGRDRPVHRWYKLRPSFSPRLVAYLIDRLNGSKRRLILDPFAGAGTTPIEAALLGRRALAVEINPFLAAYMSRALDWSASARQIRMAAREASARLQAAETTASRIGLEGILAETGLTLPAIHNVFRWWRADVLAELLAVKAILRDHDNALVRRLLWLALGAACIDAANIKRLHPTLTFHDRSQETIPAIRLVLERLHWIAEDLAHAAALPRSNVEIIEGNSRALDHALGQRSLLANVITSPPYCNRYSYVWETRPHLYMMDLLHEARRATQLDMEAVGGTWGSATFSLSKGELTPADAVLGRLLEPLLQVLRPVDNLMANYVVKYFNTMSEHFDSLGRVLRPGSRLAYVVGNSRLKGMDVPTETILVNMLRARPWCTVDSILVFRRRIGKRSLYESAILGRVR